MKKEFIKTRDEYNLDVHIFEVENPRAVIQVIHGMEEHQERYEDIIKVLNKKGFLVVSSDMRGHGKSCKELGFFKEKDGYVELIEDQKIITKFIKEHFKNIPIYILAHSMGTIITRVLLQENSKDYEKVALSGYPNYQRGAHIGILLANIISKIHGPKYKSKFISYLSVDTFNNEIKNPKTKYDWICHNEENVKSYIDDPYCGIGFTCSAFRDLFKLVIMMHKTELYNNVNKDIELLLLRGLDDPCVGGDRGANDSYKVLSDAGFSKIEKINYPNMRHEILAEKDNKKVYNDLIKFYSKN